MTWIILTILALVALSFARVMPVDPARWHKAVQGDADKDTASSALRVMPAPENALMRLDKIALQTPRTKRVSGAPEDGRITYETRSLVFGFPDYTTVDVDKDTLRIYARLRFGKADLGVNKARVEAWIAQLKS
ncbi:MAG: DUF1499 domain-containing protein [Paracoccaceae bacterium]